MWFDFVIEAAGMVQARWQQGSKEAARQIVGITLRHAAAPAGIEDFVWRHMPYRVGGPSTVLVGNAVVSASLGGRVEIQTPHGAATLPYWVGWNADHRTVVLCCGP